MKLLYYLVWVLLMCHINGDTTENIDSEISTNFSTTTDILESTTEFILESTTNSLEDDQTLSTENLKTVKKDSVTDSTTTNEVSFTTPSLEDTVESSTEYFKSSENAVQEYTSSSEATRATTGFADLHDEKFTDRDTTWRETTQQSTTSIVINEVTEKYVSNEDTTIVATTTIANNDLEIFEITTFKDISNGNIVVKSLLREKFDFDSPVVSGEDVTLESTERVTNGDGLSFDVVTETSTDIIDKANITEDTVSLVYDGTELPSRDAVTTEMISVVPDEDNSALTTEAGEHFINGDTTEIPAHIEDAIDQKLDITESTSSLLEDGIEISSVDATPDDDKRQTTEAAHIGNDDTATTDLPTTTIAGEISTSFLQKVNITDNIESFTTDDEIQFQTADSTVTEVTTVANERDNSLQTTEIEHFTNGNSLTTSAVDIFPNINQNLNNTEDTEYISNAGRELPVTESITTETASVSKDDSVQTTESEHLTSSVDLSTDKLMTSAVTETSTIIYQIPNTTAGVLPYFSTDVPELSTSHATTIEIVSNTEANNYPTVQYTTNIEENIITTTETDSTSVDNGLELSYATKPIQNYTTEISSTSSSSIDFESYTLAPVESDWLTTAYADSTSTTKDFVLSSITESTRRSSTENNFETQSSTTLGSINMISTDLGIYTSQRLDIDVIDGSSSKEASIVARNNDTSDSWGRTLSVESTTNLSFEEPTYVTSISTEEVAPVSSISTVTIESTTTAGYTTTSASSSTVTVSESQSIVNHVDFSTTEETLKTSSQHNTESTGLTTQETISVNNLPHVSPNLEKIEYTTEGIMGQTTEVHKLQTSESISINDFVIVAEDREGDESFLAASKNSTDGEVFDWTTEKEYYVELTSDSIQILLNPVQITSVYPRDFAETSTENSMLPTLNDNSRTDDSDQSSIAKVLINNATSLNDESIMAENDITSDYNFITKDDFPFPYGRNIESTVNNMSNWTDSSDDARITPSEEPDATYVVIKKTSFLEDTVVNRPVKVSNPKVIYHFQLNATHITMIGIGGGIILLTLGAVLGIWVNRRRKYEMNGQHDIP